MHKKHQLFTLYNSSEYWDIIHYGEQWIKNVLDKTYTQCMNYKIILHKNSFPESYEKILYAN